MVSQKRKETENLEFFATNDTKTKNVRCVYSRRSSHLYLKCTKTLYSCEKNLPKFEKCNHTMFL